MPPHKFTMAAVIGWAVPTSTPREEKPMTKARIALRLALGALLPPCALVQIAFAEQVVTTPFKDNTIFSEANYSSGAGNSLFAGMNANFDLRRTLIAFPVQGYVPPG